MPVYELYNICLKELYVLAKLAFESLKGHNKFIAASLILPNLLCASASPVSSIAQSDRDLSKNIFLRSNEQNAHNCIQIPRAIMADFAPTDYRAVDDRCIHSSLHNSVCRKQEL